MRRSILIFLLLTMAAASTAAQGKGATASGNFSQADKGTNAPAPVVKGELGMKLDELLSRYTGYGFSGAALVAKNGEVILHKAYGLANIESGTPNTLDTIFDIGSLTKTFTAAAILQLEAAGKLSINDPISKYLGAVPADKAGVTIYHLLSHTSGLGREAGMLRISPGATREELLQKALAAPLQSAPGTRYSYSNMGFGVLAAIIEKVSGETWQGYLQEHLFKPAGLTRTGFWNGALTNPMVARGYRGPSVDALESDPPETLSWGIQIGAGGVLSTVEDLYKWWSALQQNKILSEAARKKIFTPPPSNNLSVPNALGDEPMGWHIEKTSRGTIRIHKGGVVPTFEAQFANYVESGTVMIFTMNKNISMRAPLWDAIERVILGKDYVLPPAIATADAAELGKYAGEYELSPEAKFRAWVDKGRLVVGAIGQPAVNLLAYPDKNDLELHRDLNALSASLVEALKKNDLSQIKEVQNPGPVSGMWRALTERYGALKSYQVLGTVPRMPGVVQTYVKLDFETESEVVRLSWSENRLGPVGGGIPLPAITRFSPQAGGAFASFDYRTSQVVRIAFSTDAGGKVTALKVISKDGKSDAVARKTK